MQGRVRTYEAIVKGETVKDPGVPASFKVLVKELQSLGLAVEAITQGGDVLQFGKDEDKTRAPRLGMGLLSGSYRELGDQYWAHLPSFLKTGQPWIKMDDAHQSEAHYRSQAAALAWMLAPAAEAAAP